MAKKTELRERQDKAIIEFINNEVVPCYSKHEAYVAKCDDWTKRFEAIRSIAGLTYGDDPDKSPKLEPWEGSSDVGVPIEAITLRAIIARFVKTIFTKPICTISARGNKSHKAEDAKIIDEYNEYTLEDEMKFERKFYDIMMDVGLTGDGIGKLIEANEEYEWDETYFTLYHPDTDEPIIDPGTKCEFDQEWPDGYPIEVAEDFQPQPDIASGETPEVREITVTKTDKTYFGSKLIPVDPKDLVLPVDADDYDYNALPFIGHRFKKTWHWLNDRKGNVEDGDYDEEVIKRLRPETSENGRVPTTYKLNLLELWMRVDMPISGKDKNKVREIIALWEVDKAELLGWIINPYRGQRMFFHWQIMPMPHRARAKGIPEFAKGIRELADSIFNNMQNRDTINSHPPFVYDEESGFDPEIHEFGPQEFWGVNDKTKLGRLEMGNHDESRSEWSINFAMGLLQKLFGVNDYTLGSESKVANNGTAHGIMAIIGEGNYSFDTMIALLQMTNKEFFEANIKMHAKMMKDAGMAKKVFYVTGDQNNPFREIQATTLSAGWNFIPRGTSIRNNVEYRQQMTGQDLAILSKNALFDPALTPTTADNYREITQRYLDAREIKITLPTKDQITQEMVAVKAQVEQKVQQQTHLEQLKATAKIKKGTPEGKAAQKVLDDLTLQNAGQPKPGQAARPGPNGQGGPIQ